MLATVTIQEGTLNVLSAGEGLVRAKPEISFSKEADSAPAWVSRMYQRHNFAPGDLLVDLSRHIGSFRDYQFLNIEKEPESKTVEREVGFVVKFNDDAGFGFISTGLGDKDLFVHQTNICMEGFRELRVGERVEFTRVQGEKGPKALWVRPKRESPLPPRPKAPAFRKTSAVANSNGSADEQSEELAQILKWFGSEFKWDEWKGG